uniref:Protein phosphatase 1, regulatory (inhibitor) subunit 14C n=1 Tax=Hucho hucho TaxID=62062 RepID=A0A4W5JWI2_9TELE
MSAASTETSAQLPAAASRVFFQPPAGVGCAGSGPMPRDDPVQRKQGKVTVKYDRKELRKRLILEEWIIEQLSDLYDCEVRGRGGGGGGEEEVRRRSRYSLSLKISHSQLLWALWVGYSWRIPDESFISKIISV